MNRQQKIAVVALLIRKRRGKKSSARRWWIHPIFQKREQYGAYAHLMPDLKKHPRQFYNYLRMGPCDFAKLLGLVANR
jgi:ribosomal protein L20